MPRKRPRPGIAHETVPVTPQSVQCDGMCMDVSCERCWGDFFATVMSPDLWYLPAVPPMRVSTEVDDDTFEAIIGEAIAHGVTVGDVVRGVLRQWAGRQKARR